MIQRYEDVAAQANVFTASEYCSALRFPSARATIRTGCNHVAKTLNVSPAQIRKPMSSDRSRSPLPSAAMAGSKIFWPIYQRVCACFVKNRL